ncbi:hypothetical protein [Prosthecobacter sp.]|uniref:hypothetical protein n=1 Tax=Prosthecobacter sp. TaxID=1965333 RepID=UPI002ABBC8A8|nr:hypothetical protein [Prosthecobacter sp.]MDZ4405581.1 hypothetical protein [Prosthecobacter sp.]
MSKPFLPLIMRGAFLAAMLVAGMASRAGAQVPETIKIGPLKPMETLPSLAPSIPAAPKTETQAAAPAVQPAPPPLPTNNSLVITGPVAQAYLYVEPYQTRFEVLFDAATMLAWLAPGEPLPKTLTPAQQQQLSQQAASRAAEWCALSTADETLPVPQPLVAVIKGLPGNTLPLKEDEEVALNQAMLGFMWEFATPPGPDELNVTWKGWLQGTTKLPVRAFFGPLSETGEIHSTVKSYRWRNQGRLPRPAPLAAVPQFEVPQPMRLPLGGILWLLGGLIFYLYLKITDHKLPGGSLPFVAVWLLGAVLMSQLLVIPVQSGSASPEITQVEEAQKIVSPLLRNVYRAFDHHAESDVYDVLARSVDGELLRRLYLETIQALTLDGREGTRVTIAEFSATVDKVEANPKGDGFMADCNWMARGIVGHWGHSHPRVNIYNARITITPAKGEWKLTGLEVQEVRRL